MRFNLFIGASVGAETEDRWATLDMIDRRWPYQTGKNIAAGINAGRIRMGDKHLGHFAQDISYGFYTENGRYDIGIFEVSAVTEDGGLARGVARPAPEEDARTRPASRHSLPKRA